MKLDASWLNHPGTIRVMQVLENGSHGAWFVGGCVRNTILGAPVDDIDIATDAHPDRVMGLFDAAGIKTVPTGLAHGTVTVIAHGKPHEVTTLRRDVETDGRHATVAYSDRMEEDAQRRDFTMNALYAQPDGTVLDPTGAGLPDLSARRVRFIGDPSARIREDHLRILRFFRFHAWYADPAGGMDADALAACAALADGIDRLSKERIGAEIRKLLCAPDPAPSVASMAQTGVLACALPGADASNLTVLTGIEAATETPPDALRRLAALGGTDPVRALRLSRAEARQFDLLKDGIGTTMPAAELGYRFGIGTARDILLLRAALFETPVDPDVLRAVAAGASAVFPIAAWDLMPTYTGVALGAKLAEIEARWIASGFTLDRKSLLPPEN